MSSTIGCLTAGRGTRPLPARAGRCGQRCSRCGWWIVFCFDGILQLRLGRDNLFCLFVLIWFICAGAFILYAAFIFDNFKIGKLPLRF
jgi:hypothetical protein